MTHITLLAMRKSTTLKLIALLIIGSALMPGQIYAASSTSSSATSSTAGGYELPNDAPADVTPASDIQNNTNASNTRTQDFVTGVAIGVGFGLIAGAVSVWFLKKS